MKLNALKNPRLMALGLPFALLTQCAPSQCAPGPAETAPIVTPAPAETAPPPPPVQTSPPSNDCHPHYVECLPIGPDLDCGDIGFVVRLHNANNDEYQLDGNRAEIGDGVGCESFG